MVKSQKKREDCFRTRLGKAEKMSINISAFRKIVKNTLPTKISKHSQCRTTLKNPLGRRFELEEKVLSLTLFNRNSKSYALLSRYFSLPSPRTLKSLRSEVKLSPGINKIIFEKLKRTVKYKFNEEGRLCSLIFDQMAISPQTNFDATNDQLKGFVHQGYQIADHALVFMVKGIKENYKQPVAYYFTNNLNKIELKTIIKEVVESVQKTELIIICTICNHSLINVSAIDELTMETKAKYLRCGREWRHVCFEINKKPIIPLFDVPHLMKGLRNNLLTKDLIYRDSDDGEKIKTVKWEYFQMIYEADMSYGELNYLQKLTEEHINPTKIKKRQVKTVTQLFSHKVAVITEHLTARGHLPHECKNVIPFVLLMDKLFDSLNGDTFDIPNCKVHKGPVRRLSPHHQLWQKALGILNSIKFVSKGNTIVTTVPSARYFVKTIKGMQAIWKILSQKYYIDCMLTRNFNQDPLENFFANIRSFGAGNGAPNCMAFESAFKTLLLNNCSFPLSINANCEEDKNNYLLNFDFFIKQKYNLSSFADACAVPLSQNFPTEICESHDAGQRTYLCGWVLTKCLKNVVRNCKVCRASLLGNKLDIQNRYLRAKEYDKSKTLLFYPSYKLDKIFQDIQNITMTYLKKDLTQENIRKNIKIICDKIVTYPFDCLEHKVKLTQYFEDMTINIIIYCWCRSINRILKGKKCYDGDDEVKVIAQKYFNEHSHKKKIQHGQIIWELPMLDRN